MPTIKLRKQADGATRYTAIVRLRRQGTILHRECRTFTHRSTALSWARHREVALEDPAELARLRVSTPTLAELIRWYIDTFVTISRWQRSKQTHLEFLERHPLGKTIAHKLTSADLIRHVQSRRAEGTGPATVINDLIWIGVVLRAAKSVRELPVSPGVVQQARTACRELRLIGKPKKRMRRPTAEELARLTDVKPIRSAADHVAAMAEVKRLWGSKNGTLGGDRLNVLATLIEAYEAQHEPIDRPGPAATPTLS